MPTWVPRKRASESSSSLRKSAPATMTEPASGRSSPVITIKSVDLPEPDGPSSATASPFAICKLMSRRIWSRAAPRPSDRLTPSSATAYAEELGPEMSFMLLRGPPGLPATPPSMRARSYGGWRPAFQLAIAAALSLALSAAPYVPEAKAEPPVKIVALGDSLTAGYGLPDKDGFVPQLQAALTAKGVAASVANAGVSGDTASDGLARLDWSVPPGTDAVIVELGANDMLRGIKPEITRQALDTILNRLTQRHTAV